jgi:hypothetical protein
MAIMRAPHLVVPPLTPPSQAGSAMRPRERRRSFAREITAILVVKAIVIGALWYVFFSAPAAPDGNMDPQRVTEHLVAPSTSHVRP